MPNRIELSEAFASASMVVYNMRQREKLHLSKENIILRRHREEAYTTELLLELADKLPVTSIKIIESNAHTSAFTEKETGADYFIHFKPSSRVLRLAIQAKRTFNNGNIQTFKVDNAQRRSLIAWSKFKSQPIGWPIYTIYCDAKCADLETIMEMELRNNSVATPSPALYSIMIKTAKSLSFSEQDQEKTFSLESICKARKLKRGAVSIPHAALSSMILQPGGKQPWVTFFELATTPTPSAIPTVGVKPLLPFFFFFLYPFERRYVSNPFVHAADINAMQEMWLSASDVWLREHLQHVDHKPFLPSHLVVIEIDEEYTAISERIVKETPI